MMPYYFPCALVPMHFLPLSPLSICLAPINPPSSVVSSPLPTSVTSSIRCAGEVALAQAPLDAEEYDKCAIEIRVKFRENEEMQVGRLVEMIHWTVLAFNHTGPLLWDLVNPRSPSIGWGWNKYR